MTDLPTIDIDTVLTWGEAPGADTVAAILDRADGLVADHPTPAGRLIELVDLTTLEGSDTVDTVRALSRRALRPDPDDASQPPTAAVCVYPSLVAAAVDVLEDSPVLVASVAGAFPSGLSPLPVRLADIEAAVAAGADEIDIVLNRSAFLSGDLPTVHGDLVASIEAAEGRAVKVILETGELVTPERIHAASLLSMAAGAAFVKTSTGKIAVSATPEAVAVMAVAVDRFRAETGQRVGIKVAGGVRTVADAARYAAIVEAVLGPEWIEPGLFRIGASSLLDTLVSARSR